MEHTPILPASAPLGAPEGLLPPHAGTDLARTVIGLTRDQLGGAVEVLIALMDLADGDPDAEIGNDVEDDFLLTDNAIEQATKVPSVDFVDLDAGAYVEWATMRGSQKGGPCLLAGHEDDELAGDETDGNFAEDEDCASHGFHGSGPGCLVSDSDYCLAGEDSIIGLVDRGAGNPEDTEEDDHPGDVANEDEPGGYAQTRWMEGPGCPIADPGEYDGTEHDGDRNLHC